MKSRFTTIDIIGILVELQSKLLGFRVINVYDIDNKTYLFKLAKPSADEKAMLLVEAGIRLHTTEFDWPKNMAPSGFSMKMRKHIRNRRVESISQLGVDRIVNIQFGSGECAYHVIVELYDRGNLFLTDHTYTILHLLRPRTAADLDVKYATRERYPVELARQHDRIATSIADSNAASDEAAWAEGGRLAGAFANAKDGDQLRRILTPHFDYGPAVLEHCLTQVGLSAGAKLGRDFHLTDKTRHQLAGIVASADLLVAELTARISVPVADKLVTSPTEAAPSVEEHVWGLITYKLDETLREDPAIPDDASTDRKQ